jgi:hypothetical protein
MNFTEFIAINMHLTSMAACNGCGLQTIENWSLDPEMGYLGPRNWKYLKSCYYLPSREER